MERGNVIQQRVTACAYGVLKVRELYTAKSSRENLIKSTRRKTYLKAHARTRDHLL